MEEIVTEQLEDKGEEYMAPRKRKSSDHPTANKKCPGCGLMFHSLGRHRRFCTATFTDKDQAWDDAMDSFVDSFDRLKKLYMDAKGEARIYKRERDELAAWRDRLGNLMKGVDIER